MSTFYTKEQIDSLAVIIGQRIKNSTSTLNIIEAIAASEEYSLLSATQELAIGMLMAEERPEPAANIESFITAFNGTNTAGVERFITLDIPTEVGTSLEQTGPEL